VKRILRVIFGALGLCSGCSESRVLTPKQFTKEFADTLRKSSDGLSIETIEDFHLKVTRPSGKHFNSFLNNAYDIYKQDPKTKLEVIQKFVVAALETEELAEGVDRRRIVPVIKDRAYLEASRKEMVRRSDMKNIEDRVYEDFNSELIIFYAEDSPKNIRYLTVDALEEAKIARRELRALAAENLERLLPKIERRGGDGVYMVTAGGDYEASLLVLESIWTDGEMRVRGDFVVAIPTRDLLLVTGSEHQEGIQKLRWIAQQAFEKEFPFRLTPKLFVYRNGRFEDFENGSDPEGVTDANDPVVKVDGKHQMMNYPAGSKPESYCVAACSRMILDAGDYEFDIPLEIRDKPLNSIQVLLSKTRKYELAWRPDKTRYVLSKATLQPLLGAEPFDGFKAGDKMMIAIGVVFAPRQFAPVWTSIVDVE
jgi:uncharacterized protein YtpQ (UPF0354 family)